MTTILQSMTVTVRALALIGAACLAVAGCAGAVENITVHAPGSITADAQAATVVIIQPSTDLRPVDIIDGHGHLVGQLDERSHTVVRVPEGPTLLYAVLDDKAETADRLEGTLIAGRVYYATVGKRPGGVALVTLTPRSPEDRWSHRDQFLAATPRVQMDPQRLVRASNDLGSTLPIMEAGDAYVAKLDATTASEHVIQESDGAF